MRWQLADIHIVNASLENFPDKVLSEYT